MSAEHSCKISFKEKDKPVSKKKTSLSQRKRPDIFLLNAYLTKTTKYLLVLQNIWELVMRSVYCLLASRTKV